MALSRRCGNGVYRHPERWIDRERERERDVYLHGQRCVIALPIEFSYTGMASLMHKMTGPNSVIVRFTKRIYARVVNIARRIPNQCDIVTREFPSSSGARGGRRDSHWEKRASSRMEEARSSVAREQSCSPRFFRHPSIPSPS